jgi:hypothetical protein
VAFTSQLGTINSTLGEFMVLGAEGGGEAAAAQETHIPLVIEEGHLKQLPTGDDIVVAGVRFPPQLQDTNVSLYVSTVGDDDTGDGTAGLPFATLQRATEEFPKYIPGPGITITVNFEAGIYSFARYIPTYAYGSAVVFQGGGFVGAASGKALSNFDGSYSTDGSFAGLQYFDMDVTLTGYTVVVGEFLFVTAVVDGGGAANKEACLGLHKVIAWDGGTEVATVRVWSRVGVSALPSGTITATVSQFKTIFQFGGLSSDQGGIDVRGQTDAGLFNGMVLEAGDSSEYSNAYAVRTEAAGTMRAQTVGFHGFSRGVFLASQSDFRCTSTCGFSKLLHYSAQGGFQCDCDLAGSIINGCSTSAFIAQSGCRFRLQSGIIVGCGDAFAVQSEQATVLLFGTAMYYGDGSTTAIQARVAGTIDARSVTFTGYTADTSEATDGIIVV